MMDRDESKQHIKIYLKKGTPRHSICSASLWADIKLALKTAWLSNSARCSPLLHWSRIWKILHFSKLLTAGMYFFFPPCKKCSMGRLTAEHWPTFYFSFMFWRLRGEPWSLLVHLLLSTDCGGSCSVPAHTHVKHPCGRGVAILRGDGSFTNRCCRDAQLPLSTVKDGFIFIFVDSEAFCLLLWGHWLLYPNLLSWPQQHWGGDAWRRGVKIGWKRMITPL